jgi:hypothetical protein
MFNRATGQKDEMEWWYTANRSYNTTDVRKGLIHVGIKTMEVGDIIPPKLIFD